MLLSFGQYFQKLLWGRCYDHNFLRFSAKKLAFFSKTNAMIKILHNLALFWVKNANFFAEFFGENILKIITSVPGHPVTDFCTPTSTRSTTSGKRPWPTQPSTRIQLVRIFLPKWNKPIFVNHLFHGKSSPIICARYLCNFQKAAQSKQTPNGRTFAQAEIDVMISKYFRRRIGQKIGVFYSNYCYFFEKYWS
jgi:hypothetical protein